LQNNNAAQRPWTRLQEDCVNIVLDSDEIASHPWLGKSARAASAVIPNARGNQPAAGIDET
jgi:hypothetical protein